MIIWEDEALILSSIKYSETSLILKVFTKYHGVQRGFVKGAKNQKKGSIYESGNFVTIDNCFSSTNNGHGINIGAFVKEFNLNPTLGKFLKFLVACMKPSGEMDVLVSVYVSLLW